MKVFKFLLTGVIIAAASFSVSAEKKLDQTKILVEGNNKFALELYSKLRTKEYGDIFFSPYSISTALGMTYAGAKGKTEEGMAKLLHFTEGKKNTCKSFGALQSLLNNIQKGKNIELGIANAIWAQDEYKFLQEYVNLVEKDFNSKINFANFRMAETREKARKEINTWVEGKTNDRIKNLIAKGILTDYTKMILVNAIYFKGKWASQFKKKNTMENGLFFPVPGRKARVTMMYQESQFRYASDESVQILEMPYRGKETSMIVLLPKKKGGIAELEKTLTLDKFNKITQKLRKQKVRVYFPKFKINTGYELVKVLSEMLEKGSFSKDADFSGMNGKKTLSISNVIHKAFVEVDEEGTEAAAATAVVMVDSLSIHKDPIPTFNADHPFIFMIRENSTGSILFMGRIVNPGKGKQRPVKTQ